MSSEKEHVSRPCQVSVLYLFKSFKLSRLEKDLWKMTKEKKKELNALFPSPI
jgi:hypothetical protein